MKATNPLKSAVPANLAISCLELHLRFCSGETQIIPKAPSSNQENHTCLGLCPSSKIFQETLNLDFFSHIGTADFSRVTGSK